MSLAVALLSGFVSESFKRHRDATALAGGLAGELGCYRDAYSQIDERWGPAALAAEAGNVLTIPKLPMQTCPVYDANVGKLGLLGAELTEEVAFVYFNIYAFRQVMMLASTDGLSAQQQAGLLRGALETLGRAEHRGKPLIGRLQRFSRSEF